MWILPLVGILGSIVGFCFLTLAIGKSPPTRASTWSSIMLTLDYPYSIGTLLPFRARRGAHCHIKAALDPADLRHHRASIVTMPRGQVPLLAHLVWGRLSCCLLG